MVGLKEGPTMHDTTLTQYLLGLQSPWTMSRVSTGGCAVAVPAVHHDAPTV